MTIKKISLSEWREKYMDDFYSEVFGDYRPRNLETPGFILIGFINEAPIAFVTCIEMDGETLYWQFGGFFSKIKKSFRLLEYFNGFLSWALGLYKRVTMRVENTNTSMIKIALKCGFLIQGTWNIRNTCFLQLNREEVLWA